MTLIQMYSRLTTATLFVFLLSACPQTVIAQNEPSTGTETIDSDVSSVEPQSVDELEVEIADAPNSSGTEERESGPPENENSKDQAPPPEASDQEEYLYLSQGAFRVITGAIGFFIALFFNSLVGWYRNRRTFYSMLHAIKAEAKSNETILTTSFEPYYEDGIVLRGYSLIVATKHIADNLFIDYAPREYLDVIQEYVRTLTLGNLYRDKHEFVRFDPDYPPAAADVGDRAFNHELLQSRDSGIQEGLANNIRLCRDAISKVTQLPEKSRGFFLGK